jgi:hypothetical protein
MTEDLKRWKARPAAEFSDEELGVLSRLDPPTWSEKMSELYPLPKAADPAPTQSPISYSGPEIDALLDGLCGGVVDGFIDQLLDVQAVLRGEKPPRGAISQAFCAILKPIVERVAELELHSESVANDIDGLKKSLGELRTKIEAQAINARRLVQ